MSASSARQSEAPAAKPGKRQQQSEARRQRILEAARTCFGELGFGAATVEAIAAEAGVSNGLLYRFFKDKGELFQVVVEGVVRDWVRAMVPRDERLTPAAKLEHLLRNSVAFCETNPLLPALMTGDELLQLERLGMRGFDRVEAHRRLVASILEEGIASGDFDPALDVKAVADLVCQLHSDYSSRAYRRDPDFPVGPRLIDAAVRFIDDAVRAKPSS